MRMSHWIDAPVIFDTVSNTEILSLEGDVWHLLSAKETISSIMLVLARYPSINTEYELILNPIKDVATINGITTKIGSVLKTLKAII